MTERPTSLSEKHKTQLQCHSFNESRRDRNFVGEHLSPFAAATESMHTGTDLFFFFNGSRKTLNDIA